MDVSDLLQSPVGMAVIAGVALLFLRNPAVAAIVIPILRMIVPQINPGPTPGPSPDPLVPIDPTPDPSAPLAEILKLVLPNLIPILRKIVGSSTGRATTAAILAEQCSANGHEDEAAQIRALIPKISTQFSGDQFPR